MTPLLTIVVYMTVLMWLTFIGASLIRIKIWTWQGVLLGVGNRDNLPPLTPLTGRAERTARNTLEGYVLFVALALIAHVTNRADPLVMQGAQLFFWARVLYIPLYYAGIIWVRTLVWMVGIVGLGMMVCSLLK